MSLRLLPDDGVDVPGHVRLDGPDQDLPGALPRRSRRHDRCPDSHVAPGDLDPPRWRLLRLGHLAPGTEHQGDAAASGHRARGLRTGYSLFRRWHRTTQRQALVLLSRPGPDP